MNKINQLTLASGFRPERWFVNSVNHHLQKYIGIK